LPAALARVAPEALGDISITDSQLKLMNDAIDTVAKLDANAKYIREAAARAASSTKEQSRPVDTAEKLPNNILRVRIKLSPKQGIVDSKGNPVTGTYYLVIDTTKKKQTNIPYDRNGNKVNDYSYTMYDDVPIGWKRAFGKIMLEEYREVLIRKHYLKEFQWVQVKEKYGTLRLYSNAAPMEVLDLESKYDYISGFFCISCGRMNAFLLFEGSMRRNGIIHKL
jgi:hypothetical protein